MKSFGIALLATGAAAFPHLALEGGAEAADRAYGNLLKRQNAAAPQGVGANPPTPPPFDAAAQFISVDGEYKFVPPGSGDARGECPGLNAMANHGYLPHNGFATTQQFIDATTKVFGMGADLATFLAVFGSVVDGNGAGWSINGAPHVGIGGSHGDYEGDSSPLKSDLNQYGDNGKLVMEQFYTLYNMQPDAATANYNLEVLREFRGKRFQESIAKNPYFYYGAFSGVAVSQAAFTFIYRFMANHSAEYPEGVLNKANLKSFMSIYGPEDKLYWKRGWERIPENWYRRSEADAYTIPYFLTDIGYFAETQPEIIGVGCNAGQVNTYHSLNLAQLTGGAYDASSANASPFCLASAFSAAEISSQSGLSASALAPLTDALNSATAGMNCPPISQLNLTMLQDSCPGFAVYGGPTGPVAPGAIQS